MGLGIISKHSLSVLVVGLDNSGKTTVVDWMANKSARSTAAAAANGIDNNDEEVIVPTIGFSARRFTFAKTPVTVLDMSGQGRYRNLWRYYLRQCDAIVYVVDAGDDVRLPVALAELRLLLNDPVLIRRRPRLPVLILANKSDLLAAADNQRRLAGETCVLCRDTQRTCRVVASCARTGDALKHAFDWLLKQIAAAGPSWRQDRKPTWYW